MRRQTYELNAPLRTVPLNAATTTPRMSLLSTNSDHIVVETIKAAEDGDGLIVRLYEAHNQRGHITLCFIGPVMSAEQVDLLERPVGMVKIDGGTVHAEVRPFDVKTLRVRLGNASYRGA